MTRGDAAIVGVVILCALASVPVALAGASAGSDAVIISGPGGTTAIDPRVDGAYAIEGRTGTVIVQASDGEVWVASADCPDRLCVRSGLVRPGRPVVCAPNGVSVRCAIGSGGGLDAVSR